MRPTFMTRWRHRILLIGVLTTMWTAAGCRWLGVDPSAGPSAVPSSIDEQGAVQLVLAQDERFRGIRPRDPDLIGQAAWYEAAAAQSGWRVTIRIGWGDCPAGCIDQHTWTYDVTTDGQVTLTSQDGPPVPVAGRVHGMVTKGPICPVERDPPDPNCADLPVADALLVIEDISGSEVTRVTSAADGSFSADLAPGAYRIVPQPVDGLLGTAQPVEFRVEAGDPSAELQISYDTGIR